MDLQAIGEFGLIERLRAFQRERPGLLQGIGDDAAVLEGPAGRHLLVTADALVEGVHFLLDRTSPYDLGRKAMAVNISDIAAMAGTPTFAVVCLGAGEKTPVRLLEEVYRGLADEAGRFGAALVGGDVVRAPVLTLAVTLLGEVPHEAVRLRSGALVGDRICVTHRLGDAAAGLECLLRPDLPVEAGVRQRTIFKQLRPTPRVEAGRELGQGMATAMLDLSDGLAGDLGHLCRASGVGAVIRAADLPVSDDVRAVAAAAGKDPLELALRGGEDYELLFTTASLSPHQERLPRSGTPVTVVGEILPASEGLWLELPGGERRELGGGFAHY